MIDSECLGQISIAGAQCATTTRRSPSSHHMFVITFTLSYRVHVSISSSHSPRSAGLRALSSRKSGGVACLKNSIKSLGESRLSCNWDRHKSIGASGIGCSTASDDDPSPLCESDDEDMVCAGVGVWSGRLVAREGELCKFSSLKFLPLVVVVSASTKNGNLRVSEGAKGQVLFICGSRITALHSLAIWDQHRTSTVELLDKVECPVLRKQ